MRENLISITLSLIITTVFLFKSLYQPPMIVFLNVGQGDSMLYSHKNTQVLVDGGPGDYLANRIGNYIPFYDRNIELMILTHAHLDHYAGLGDILKTFKVDRLVVPKAQCKPDYVYQEFLRLVETEGTIVEDISHIELDKLKISFPVIEKGSCPKNSLEINNSSIITVFEYEEIKILNMGDLEAEKEGNIEVEGVDILKAGHHCSKTSSTEGFLKGISPLVGICSLGENSYGHPSISVLERFKENNVDVYLTKDEGDILVNLKMGLIYNHAGKLLKKL